MKFLPIFFFVLLLGCNSKSKLKVAVSSNLQFAMTDIVSSFENKFQIEVDLIPGSSGKLSAQIEQGAPFDVFVSADTIYPYFLLEKGFADSEMKVYASGSLILWSVTGRKPSVDSLLSNSVKKIAIPNPKTAPYGKVSVDFLKDLGVYEKVKHKLIFGESVSQVNQFIISGAVDAGFTSQSVVFTDKAKSIGHWGLIEPHCIQQGAVVLKKSSKNRGVMDFYDFLFSSESREILEKYGYSVN